jgi:hypothetical protein
VPESGAPAWGAPDQQRLHSVQRDPNTEEPVTKTPVVGVEDRKDREVVVGERCVVVLSVGLVDRGPLPRLVPATGRWRRRVPATGRWRAFPVRRRCAGGASVVPAIAARRRRRRRSLAREAEATRQVGGAAVLIGGVQDRRPRRVVRRVWRLSPRCVEDRAGRRRRRVAAALGRRRAPVTGRRRRTIPSRRRRRTIPPRRRRRAVPWRPGCRRRAPVTGAGVGRGGAALFPGGAI